MSLQEVCRLCLDTIKDLDSLSEKNAEDKINIETNVSLKVVNLIECYLGIQISPDETFHYSDVLIPSFVCAMCQNKLLQFHEFRNKVYQLQENIFTLYKESKRLSPENSVPLKSTEEALIEENRMPNITFVEVVETDCLNTEEMNIATSFQCDFCNNNFKSKTTLKRHMLRYHMENPSINCQHCEKTFKTSYALNNHFLYKHSSNRKRLMKKCEYCNKIMKNKNAYNNHIRTLHKEVTEVTCNECNKLFKNYETFKRHKNEQHNPNKVELICKFCSKKFTRRGHFIEHEAIHLGTKRFKCEWCSKNFRNSSNWSTHRSINHPKEYLEWKRNGILLNGAIQ